MIKSIISAIALAFAFFAAAPAMAAGYTTGLVKYPGYSGDVFYFQNWTATTSKPGCNSNDRWVADTSTNAGKNAMAMVLLAKSLGATIYVVGTGSCSIWGDSETLDHIYINE